MYSVVYYNKSGSVQVITTEEQSNYSTPDFFSTYKPSLPLSN